MQIEYSRIGPSGVLGTMRKDFDGGPDAGVNPHRIEEDLFGSATIPDPENLERLYNPEDPLQQCRRLDQCHWTAIKRITL